MTSVASLSKLVNHSISVLALTSQSLLSCHLHSISSHLYHYSSLSQIVLCFKDYYVCKIKVNQLSLPTEDVSISSYLEFFSYVIPKSQQIRPDFKDIPSTTQQVVVTYSSVTDHSKIQWLKTIIIISYLSWFLCIRNLGSIQLGHLAQGLFIKLQSYGG